MLSTHGRGSGRAIPTAGGEEQITAAVICRLTVGSHHGKGTRHKQSHLLHPSTSPPVTSHKSPGQMRIQIDLSPRAAGQDMQTLPWISILQ